VETGARIGRAQQAARTRKACVKTIRFALNGHGWCSLRAKEKSKTTQIKNDMNTAQISPLKAACSAALIVGVVSALAASTPCPNKMADYDNCHSACRDESGNPRPDGIHCTCSVAPNLIFCDYHPGSRCDSTGNVVSLRIDSIDGTCTSGHCGGDRNKGTTGWGTIMQTSGC
jgi:hypothetical protein